MRIHFERRGGFTGIPLRATIDLEELPPADRDRLQEMIRAADFFSLPSQIKTPAPIPDRFQFTVTIETAEQSHTVSADETAAPPSLRALLQALNSTAQLRRKAQ